MAHVGENLLGKLRDGIRVIAPPITTALLSMVDAIQYILSQIESIRETENREFAEIDNVIGELVNIAAGNLKSNLCDVGLPCTLTPPKVERAADCRIITIPGGVS